MSTNIASSPRAFLAASFLAAASSAQVVVDGDITGDSYGTARTVQTVETQFGDNLGELDAAYATVHDGRLYVALTGNVRHGIQKLELLIDSRAGGENVYSGVPGNDTTIAMTGLTFDDAFTADYHLILRRGDSDAAHFDVDMAILGTPDFSHFEDVFGGSDEGSGSTGTGPANASAIEVGYDDSNMAGIVEGTGPANWPAALAVTTGLELGIDLADIGHPAGAVRILAFLDNNHHNYASNQFLGGVLPPQGNLGGDGTGIFTGVMNFDLGDFVGNQFFTVTAEDGPGTPLCFGDGSGAPCGCGNESASPTGCLNSAGVGALLSASGVASVSDDSLTLLAENVLDQPGMFFQGDAVLGGGAGATFGDGLRCCGVNVVRIQTVNPPGSASPTAVQSTVLATSVSPLGALLPGDQKCYQYAYRDPSGGVCGSSFNLSNAVRVTWGL